MSKELKERKSKKKVKKSHKSEDERLSENDEYAMDSCYGQIPMNFESTFNSKLEQSIIIDASSSTLGILKGRKGHINFLTKQSISTGTYYFEATITSLDHNILEYLNSKRVDDFSKKYYDNVIQNIVNYFPNVRVGIIRDSGDFELPLGAEEKSFGYRARDGYILNDGISKEGNETFCKGDTIGVLVHLKPPMPEFLKNTSSQANECYIKFYKNGKEQPELFFSIPEGTYHAAVTLFNFSQVYLNFGPSFLYQNSSTSSLKLFK